MELFKKFSSIKLSLSALSIYERLVNRFKTADEKAAATLTGSLCDLVDITVASKGSEFAKKYFELQAKRLDTLLSGDVDSHKKSLDDLLSLFEGNK